MKKMLHRLITLLVFTCAAVSAQSGLGGRAIDAANSLLRVHVYKTGLFSAFAHNHDIEAPIESGEVTETAAPSVELRVDARKLRVLDPDASADTRAVIQKTMLSPQVLDTDRHAEIYFRSTAVQPNGPDHWTVTGNLDLHGQTSPVAIDVVRKDGRYTGSGTLKQTAFGIAPVTVAGGAVKVKDEVRIDFQIVLSP
jgi:polyisoprenoid-binding protein YceI